MRMYAKSVVAAPPAAIAVIIAGLLLLGISIAAADDAKKPGDAKASAAPAKKLSFHRDIRPILRVNCQGCHQPARPMGKLVLTSYAEMKKGGESNEPGF